MMDNETRMKAIRDAAEVIAPRVKRRATGVAVVLGSGLGGVADSALERETLSYDAIPGFPRPGVEGHAGEMVFGRVGQTEAVFLQGRGHLYEGYDADTVALPVRALILAGVRTLVLTNACGGVSERVATGDIVLIDDHMNLTGSNPLVGPNLDELGPRFPGMAQAYDAELRELSRHTAAEIGVPLTSGVYAGLLGPNYETAAEVAALRSTGADVVGMSTVLETIAAKHAGARVLGFSLVTNMAGTASDDHAAVLKAAADGTARLGALLTAVIGRIVEQV